MQSSQSILRLLKSRTPSTTTSLLLLRSNFATIKTTPSLLLSQPQHQHQFHSSSTSNYATPVEDGGVITESIVPKEKKPTKVKIVKSTIGSGQGGKKEKDALTKLQLAAEKEKLKLKALKEKEKTLMKKLKEKEKEKEKVKKGKLAAASKDKVKEKEKEKKLKLKAKALKDKLKLKLQVEKAKAKKAVSVPKKKRAPTSSLRPPKIASNSWAIFLTDFVAERKASTPAGEKMDKATKLAQEAAPIYRDLAPSDRQDLARRAQEARDAYPALYATWKATLTPAMIKEENLVRKARRASGLSHKRPLKLEGEPKRPAMPFLLFCTDIRNNRSDEVLKGETAVLAQSKLMAAAWRELPAEEKDVYTQEYMKAKSAYTEEKAAFLAKFAEVKEEEVSA